MYFKDKGGKAVLSSADGVALDITDAVATDVVNAVPVPGKARADLGEIPWIGARTEYKGRTARIQQGYVQLKIQGFLFQLRSMEYSKIPQDSSCGPRVVFKTLRVL